MRRQKLRRYLVARGGRCFFCLSHGWKACRDPEERDGMQPCIRVPIYTIEAPNKREAVAHAQERYATELRKAGEMP